MSYVYRGRFSSRFVPHEQAKAARAELANYQRLRELTEKWVGLSLRLAKEKSLCGRDRETIDPHRKNQCLLDEVHVS